MLSTSNHLGKLAEVITLKQLVKEGYQVALPFGNQAHWDILILENGHWKSAQIKAATYRGGKRLAAQVVRTVGRKTRERVPYSPSDVDYIVVVDLLTECLWKYPTPVVGHWLAPAVKDIWIAGHAVPQQSDGGPKTGAYECNSRRVFRTLAARPEWMKDRDWAITQMMQAGKSMKELGSALGIRTDSASKLAHRVIRRLARKPKSGTFL